MLLPAWVVAAPSLSIESFTIKAGETKEMLIDLTNPDTQVTLVQFDLRLPSGLSIATENGEMVFDIVGRTTWRKHSLDANASNGITRFLLASNSNAVLSGTSGAIISITLTAASSFNGGDIKLEEQLIVTPNAEETKPATYTYHIEGTQSDAVTIKAKSYSRVYGEANPTFGYEVTEGTITSGTPTVTCSATKTSPVGTYDIVINEGSVSNGTVNLVNGTLTITKAPLTIYAGNYTKVEGEANPTFTPTFSGFKNGETKSVLTTQPTVTTTATTTSPAGTYPVTVSGAAAQNYSFTYVAGTLTVTAKPVVKEIIQFADATVKAICVANWDTDNDGELSKDEAAAVTDIGQVFRNSNIASFDDLQYFTGLISVGKRAFSGCKQLKSITLPSNITSIGDNAFTSCESLLSLNIPAGVTTIGESALAGLRSLQTLTVDTANQYFVATSNVLYSKDQTRLIFCSPQKSGSFTVPNTVKELAENSFYLCDKLTSVTLPNRLTTIGAAAFAGCGITTLNIPASVTEVGYDYACKNLSSFTVDAANAKYYAIDGVLFQKSPMILIAYPPAKGNVYEIPSGTETIFFCSFLESLISEVQLPSSITEIDTYSFGYCKNLTSVTIHSKTPPTCNEAAFYQSSASTGATLYVPSGSKAAYQAAEGWKDFANIVEMEEDGIESVNNGQRTMDNAIIYNLSGQRLSQPQRGVNIINGKKVVMK